jgi:hypothetical protein
LVAVQRTPSHSQSPAAEVRSTSSVPAQQDPAQPSLLKCARCRVQILAVATPTEANHSHPPPHQFESSPPAPATHNEIQSPPPPRRATRGAARHGGRGRRRQRRRPDRAVQGRGRHQAHLPQLAPAGADQQTPGRRSSGGGGPAGDGGPAPRLPRPRRPPFRQPLPPRAPGPAPDHRHRPLIR